MNNNELAASIASQVAQTKVYAKGDSVFITLTRDPFDSKAWTTYKEAIAYVKDSIAAHGVQFTLELKGVQGFLVPTSPAARERQKRAGRYLSPYNWVASKEREDVVVLPPEETKP